MENIQTYTYPFRNSRKEQYFHIHTPQKSVAIEPKKGTAQLQLLQGTWFHCPDRHRLLLIARKKSDSTISLNHLL